MSNTFMMLIAIGYFESQPTTSDAFKTVLGFAFGLSIFIDAFRAYIAMQVKVSNN